MKHPHRIVKEKFKLKEKAKVLSLNLDDGLSISQVRNKVKDHIGRGVRFEGFLIKAGREDEFEAYLSVIADEKERRKRVLGIAA